MGEKILFKLNKANQQRQLEKMVWVYPAHLGMFATYLRNQGNNVIWDGKDDGTFQRIIEDDRQIDVDFDKLPFPDRKFTDAKNPRFQCYGNYKYKPATHSMISNLCWYSKCVFCSDTERMQIGEKRFVRSVEHYLEEIDDLISNNYRECFDDSGTIPIGRWLIDFCEKMIKSGRNKKIVMGCNLKPVKNIDYKMMKEAGFRFILTGIESANQHTVDMIKKGQKSEDIIPIMKSMADAGLEAHLTTMFGYDFETHEDAMRTVNLVHYLLKKGYAKTAQASVYSPPRTKPDPNSPGHKYIPMVYDAYKSPTFWIQKLKDLKRWEDFTYLLRGARLVIEEKIRKIGVH